MTADEMELERAKLALERERLEFEIIKEKRSFWRSPLIVAILTAGAAALANIYVSFEGNERETITTMLKNDNINQTVENLSFLVETKLVRDNSYNIVSYLNARQMPLRVKSLNYSNLKSIQLTNPDGAVPIVIVDANFRRNNEVSKRLYTLFKLPKGVAWDTYVNLPKGKTIQPGESVELVRLSTEGLMAIVD